MNRYKIIEENCCNGYILDTEENTIVAIVETKRPDLGFDKLKTLIEKANKVKAYEDTGLEPEDVQDLKDCIEGEGDCGVDENGLCLGYRDEDGLLCEECRTCEYCANNEEE